MSSSYVTLVRASAAEVCEEIRPTSVSECLSAAKLLALFRKAARLIRVDTQFEGEAGPGTAAHTLTPQRLDSDAILFRFWQRGLFTSLLFRYWRE